MVTGRIVETNGIGLNPIRFEILDKSLNSFELHVVRKGNKNRARSTVSGRWHRAFDVPTQAQGLALAGAQLIPALFILLADNGAPHRKMMHVPLPGVIGSR